MARPLPRATHYWYVPEYRGNREDPEPIEVQLRVPTYGEQRALGADRNGRPLTTEEITAYIAEHVGEVRRLVLDDGTPITSGADLQRHIDQIDGNFVAELDRALASFSSLEAGLKKNSPSGPGSGASIPPIVGTAVTAAPSVSIESATAMAR